MNSKVRQLHERNVRLYSAYRNLEGSLIEALQEFDRHQGFRKMGYRSLYSYCCENLKMSENQALTLIRISRKAVEVPALKEAVIKKEITLSSAKVIAPIITSQNHEIWIEKAKALSKPALEREIVKVNPKAIKTDRMVPLTGSLSEARGVLSEESKKVLERVKELESKRMSRPCDLDAAILAMGKLYLKKYDPVEKAKRSKSTGPQVQLDPKPNRKIPAGILHQVNLRDQSNCRAKQNGKLCGSRHYTQIHHIRPYGRGGTHALTNLVTLCAGHHRSIHEGASLEFDL